VGRFIAPTFSAVLLYYNASMEDLGSEFLLLYNQLDHRIRELTHADQSDPFWRRVKWAARDCPEVRRVRDDIMEFHELRNAIIHNREFPERLIATPSEEAVAHLRRIVEGLVSPARLTPTFAREVHVFELTNPLSKALAYMERRDYSQVVVRHPEGLRLLTAEGISRWLAGQAQDEPLVLDRVVIADVLPFGTPKAGLLMPRNSTVDEAREAFDRTADRNNPRLHAIIITENGKPGEEPLGIVTPWDLLDEG
jgi:CBS domain-containing protein